MKIKPNRPTAIVLGTTAVVASTAAVLRQRNRQTDLSPDASSSDPFPQNTDTIKTANI